MAVELTVHKKHVVSLLFCSFYICVLLGAVCGIEIDDVAFLVGLSRLYEKFILIEGIVFSIHILEQEKFLCAFVEFFIGQHAVFDEDLDVVPFLLKAGAVVLEHLGKAFSHFFGDIG